MVIVTEKAKGPIHWPTLLAAVIAGWIVFLFAAFLVVIAMSALASKFGVIVETWSFLFFAELALAGVVSITCGYLAGRRIRGYLSHKQPIVVYTALAILVFLAIVSFPRYFIFAVP